MGAILAGILLISTTSMIPRGLEANASTFEAWEFNALGDILAISSEKDVSGDAIDDLVVAVNKFVYLVDGATGKEIWTYSTEESHAWIAAITMPDSGVSGSEQDVIIASEDRLIMLLDGATGKQIWNFTSTEDVYDPSDLCYLAARSIHPVSDIDGDDLPDAVLVSGSGDQCSKDDKFTVLAFSAKNGKKLWEYGHEEDYHGLKDGTKGSSPAGIIDMNQDGTDDITIVDDHNIVYVIDGSAGNVIEMAELEVLGAIWNLMVVPDLSGDAIDDVIAFEFIDGAGGPDYASVDAIDLSSSEVLWQVKAGDGLYDGGAIYSSVWLTGGGSAKPTVDIAVTQRIENELELLLLDGNTGQVAWRFKLGEDRSRNDLVKYYPIARVPDLNMNGYDDIAIGSIDSMIHLLEGLDADIIWSHSVDGSGNLITSIPVKADQRYIVVADESNLKALAVLTIIRTELSIDASSQTVLVARKVIVSGTISPSLPGEIVQLRYIDPSGFVIMRPLIIAQDGSYTDTIEPKAVGNWKVSANFAGEGFYTSSQSPTITFTVENETRNSVYRLDVESEDSTTVSYPVSYFIEGGRVTEMSIDRHQKSLNIAITPTGDTGALRIELSRSIIDAWDTNYQVYVDGRNAEYDEIESDMEKRILSIPFSADSEMIQVVGTYIIPEFPAASVMLALAIFGMITVIAMRNRFIFKA